MKRNALIIIVIAVTAVGAMAHSLGRYIDDIFPRYRDDDE